MEGRQSEATIFSSEKLGEDKHNMTRSARGERRGVSGIQSFIEIIIYLSQNQTMNCGISCPGKEKKDKNE